MHDTRPRRLRLALVVAVIAVRFAAPEVVVDRGRLRPIVWLDCRGVP